MIFSTYTDMMLRRMWPRNEMSKGKIAENLGCTVEEVNQRAKQLDLGVRRDRRALDSPDLEFAKLLLAARKQGLEHFTLGVDKTPGTQHPQVHACRPAFVASSSALGDA